MRTALFLTDGAEIGGGQRVLLDLLERIDHARVRPILVTIGDGAIADRARRAGVIAKRLPAGARLVELRRTSVDLAPALRALPELAAVVRWLARELARERVDVVVTGTTDSHLFGGLAARLAGARVVARVHDIVARPGFGPLALRVDAFALGTLAHRVLPVSEAARRALVALGVADRKLRVVYNGVESRPRLDAAGRARVRLRLGIGADAFVVTSAARLERWKGQHLLLEAVPGLVQRFPNAQFLIAGDAYDGGAYRAELARTIVERGLGSRVHLLGHRADVHEILAASDIFAHTSTLPDPLPTALLDAIAAGTYVIAADAGGVREIVASSGIGRLYAPGDVAALVAAVAPAAQDPASAARALERFSMPAYVEAMTSELG